MGMNSAKICSSVCGARCCREVGRVPFLGERYEAPFYTLFLGAFPDIEGPSPTRRPFVVEFQVPQEFPHCLALDAQGLCTIYDERPISCRRFPMTDDGGIHPFCPLDEVSLGEDVHGDREYLRRRDAIDGHILRAISQGLAREISDLLQEERPFEAPLLYNGYLILMLEAAGLDPSDVLSSQKRLLETSMSKGYKSLTFIIPETDYVVGAETEGLLANLEWLEHRLHHLQMGQKVRIALETILSRG